MRPRSLVGAVERVRQLAIENIRYQGALAGTGDAGHDYKLAQRDLHVYIFEVIFACASNTPRRTVTRAPFGGQRKVATVREIIAGQRVGIGNNIGIGALGNHVTAMLARARTNIDD